MGITEATDTMEETDIDQREDYLMADKAKLDLNDEQQNEAVSYSTQPMTSSLQHRFQTPSHYLPMYPS